MWAIGGILGPVIGGSLAQQGQWRWCFCKFFVYFSYLFIKSIVMLTHAATNKDLALPINGLALVLVLVFLRLPTPPGNFWVKLMKVDWM